MFILVDIRQLLSACFRGVAFVTGECRLEVVIAHVTVAKVTEIGQAEAGRLAVVQCLTIS